MNNQYTWGLDIIKYVLLGGFGLVFAGIIAYHVMDKIRDIKKKKSE